MNIPGYSKDSGDLAESPVSGVQFEAMKEAALFGDADVRALRRSGPILEPRIEEILDVWYGFVGSKPFLLEHFSDRESGAPIDDYLARVRARFGQWIRDTAAATYDDAWLRWQFEIAKRHHRVGKNQTDSVSSSAIVPFRYLMLLAQPIVHTLRPFLASTSESTESIDAMQDAWRKSVLLQVTLWSFPYVNGGDY